jgi:predicted Ser/Thr protein kinase
MTPDDTLRVDAVPAPDDEGELIRSTLDGDYEIVGELGRGGMAVVYRALERSLEREVAIKVLPLARTFDAELVARFQREARLSASLEHPHIIPVYRVGQSGRVNFIVMKYMRGPSLSELLTEGRPMEPAEVEKLLLQIADALDHAHERGIVHRDVKPDNIMKDQTGRYVVMDFGIAKSVAGTQLTQTGGSIGTPRYMSPEQAKGAALDGRSDFYSLGIVGYHCLVGRVPYEGDDPLAILYSHLHDPLPEPNLGTDDARRVYAAIERLLAKDPAERIHGGAALLTTLSQATPSSIGDAPSNRARHPGVRVPTPSAFVAWLGARGRRFWMAAGSGIVVAAVLIGRGGPAAQCRAAMPERSNDDRAVLLEPPGTVARGAEIDLSYVACGFADDEPLSTQVRIQSADRGGVVGRVGRFFGGGSDPFRESWDDGADGFATARERRIAPGDLQPGSYRLALQVEGSDGRATVASHDFTIVDR